MFARLLFLPNFLYFRKSVVKKITCLLILGSTSQIMICAVARDVASLCRRRYYSPGAYVVNESPVRLSGCKGATYINVLRGHQGT